MKSNQTPSFINTLKFPIRNPLRFISSSSILIDESLKLIIHKFKNNKNDFFETDRHRRSVYIIQTLYFQSFKNLTLDIKLLKKPSPPIIKNNVVRNYDINKSIPLKSYLIYEFIKYELLTQAKISNVNVEDDPINFSNEIKDIVAKFNEKYSLKIGKKSSKEIRTYLDRLNLLKKINFFSLNNKSIDIRDVIQKRNQFIADITDSISHLEENHPNLNLKVLEHLKEIKQFLNDL